MNLLKRPYTSSYSPLIWQTLHCCKLTVLHWSVLSTKTCEIQDPWGKQIKKRISKSNTGSLWDHIKISVYRDGRTYNICFSSPRGLKQGILWYCNKHNNKWGTWRRKMVWSTNLLEDSRIWKFGTEVWNVFTGSDRDLQWYQLLMISKKQFQ